MEPWDITNPRENALHHYHLSVHGYEYDPGYNVHYSYTLFLEVSMVLMAKKML